MNRRLTFIVLLSISSILSVDAIFGFNKGLKTKLLFREPPPPVVDEISRAVTVDYITQRIDNFDPTNHDTYEMRFYRNPDYFNGTGPIFIYVGGEWQIYAGSLMGGHMFDMAVEMNAYMFYTEHRYYGLSVPTEDASTENLRYLTIDQALADLAHFIVHVKREPGLENAPVILVGGSYSATMVAWFRKKYPHLAIGAWASSAPLLAKIDFFEYKEIVGGSILHVGGFPCFQRLENAFAEMERLVANNEVHVIEELFNLCGPLEDEYDIWNFFSTLTDAMAGIVQYHSPGDIEDELCGVLMEPAESDLAGFLNFWSTLTSAPCFDASFENSVEFFRNGIEWGTAATYTSYRQWIYQTCAEFGWYQTSGSRFQPFGSSFPVDLYTRFCEDVYGEVFDNHTVYGNADRVNILYGGLNLDVKNVFFTHGMIDPWRAMGVQTDLNYYAEAVVIPGASHCQDLRSISDTDSPEMLDAKLRIKALVRLWIAEATNSPSPY